ncbi:MAG: hypothetical protein WEB04_02085 [Dehalococcoidia bacterium]
MGKLVSIVLGACAFVIGVVAGFVGIWDAAFSGVLAGIILVLLGLGDATNTSRRVLYRTRSATKTEVVVASTALLAVMTALGSLYMGWTMSAAFSIMPLVLIAVWAIVYRRPTGKKGRRPKGYNA